MSEHFHALVWIDHREARVFHFNADEVERLLIHPEHPTRHIHHKANAVGSGNSAEDQHFYGAVVDAIGAAGAILITGPANAKLELVKHIERYTPQLRQRITAVESVDHPSDGALLAYARKHFPALDRMAK